jgi:ligand-binding sensor domain-containing protein
MFIDPVGEVSLPAPNLVDPVYALLAWRDTAWIGTDRGLAYLARGDREAGTPIPWRAQLEARTSVYGVGTVGDTLVVMTRSALVRRDPATGEWIASAPLGSVAGTLRAFHATPFGLWVGGDRGAAFVTPSGAVLQTLSLGRELPDAVTAIAATERFLWVGTLRGLVRLAISGR